MKTSWCTHIRGWRDAFRAYPRNTQLREPAQPSPPNVGQSANRTADDEYLADCDLYVNEQLEQIKRGDRTFAGSDRDDPRRFLYEEYFQLERDSLAHRLGTIREGLERAKVIRIFSALD